MRPSVRERVLAERVADAVDPDLVGVGANSDVLSFAIAFAIAALRSGVSRRSPSGAAKTRLSTAALLGRELGLDEVGRLLRVRARDLELVLEAAADGGDEDDQPGE